jgi:hypothetical protein
VYMEIKSAPSPRLNGFCLFRCSKLRVSDGDFFVKKRSANAA